jgi:hypothetical protein
MALMDGINGVYENPMLIFYVRMLSDIFYDVIDGWTSLIDIINGPHYWTAIMDGINGWH